MQLQLDPIYKLSLQVLGTCSDVQHTQRRNHAEDADKNFDNIIAATKNCLIADLLLVILLSLHADRRSTASTMLLTVLSLWFVKRRL